MIKTILNNTDKKDNEYPCIKSIINCDGKLIIVLFQSYKCGTCLVNENNSNEVGIFSKNYDEHRFELYNNNVTLKNV